MTHADFASSINSGTAPNDSKAVLCAMPEGSQDAIVGNQLYAAGCKQGAIFRAEGAEGTCNEGNLEDDVPGLKRFPVGDSLLVVISQECDVLSNREPEIEALVCRIESNKDLLSDYERNSSRFFVVNPEQGLVACAWERIRFSKTLAQRYVYDDWPSDRKRFERFSRWLGRRYTRPALPDEIVEWFDKPLQKVLRKLQKQKPQIMRHFSEAFHEMRLASPSRNAPPFDVSVLLMARGDGLTLEQLEASQQVEAAIREVLNGEQITLEDFAPVLETELSVAEYFRTAPLFSEGMTYQGNDVIGEEPYEETS